MWDSKDRIITNGTLPPRIDTPSTSRVFVHVVLQKVGKEVEVVKMTS